VKAGEGHARKNYLKVRVFLDLFSEEMLLLKFLISQEGNSVVQRRLNVKVQ
jgi:hypothetical protein